MVQRNINALFVTLQPNHQYGGVHGILALSYHDLPFHLKPCFLYLSQYPEDWLIKKKTLLRLWIAEGFISQPTKADEVMEDKAEQYLEELVTRCMIQVNERDHTGSGVKICRMHDLVRDMCISKAKDENFLGVLEHRDTSIPEPTTSFITLTNNQSRRVAIHLRLSMQEDWLRVPLLKRGDSQLRSLFYFAERREYKMTKQQITSISDSFTLLRVLNVENVRLSSCTYGLPREIGNLIHLRYLGLRKVYLFGKKHLGYRYPALPDSISKWRGLHTLDLRDNYPTLKLPSVLWKLECLRHLLVDKRVRGLHGLDSLRNLETLKWVKARNLIRKQAMLHMSNLRHLAVHFKTKEEAEVVLKSPIFTSGCLRSLKMRISYKSSFPKLEALSGCQYLTKAVLIGDILENVGSLSHSLEFLPASLTKFILSQTCLTQDPMVVLEKLPSLRFLSLEHEAYIGSKMVCSAHGFLKLEYLELILCKVEEWRVEEGAMPSLKTLNLERLEKLKMIPEGLKFVICLQELKLNQMSRFEKRVKIIDGVKGEDFHKVNHIPSISFGDSYTDLLYFTC